MKFSNSLNMSVILVCAFVCLHFYEAAVEKKYNGYDSILSELIDEKKNEIQLFTDIIENSREKSKNDKANVKSLKRDLNILKNLVFSHKSLKLESSKNLFNRYNVDQNLTFRGNISAQAHYSILDSISKKMHSIYSEISDREKSLRQSNMHLIIKDRQLHYSPNQSYNLNFELVDLCKSFSGSHLVVEVDGENHEEVNFPIEIDFMPKTIAFRAMIEDPVSGKVHKIHEVYRP